MTEQDEVLAAGSPKAAGVHAADLFCEVCGTETAHRIVHLDGPGGKVVSGLARCRICRTTHRFRSEAAGTHDVFEIASDGPSSIRSTRSLPATAVVEVGELLPDRDPPAQVHKIDRIDGRTASVAKAREIHTVWVTPDVGAVVKISLVEGRRTTAAKLTFPPDTVLSVGGSVEIQGGG
ncbi:MAG: hypothetical protein L3J77_03095, partial [Thermoplasmata archaeon]|nr:hypothetical protein [Thermoplasmata archaeon]